MVISIPNIHLGLLYLQAILWFCLTENSHSYELLPPTVPSSGSTPLINSSGNSSFYIVSCCCKNSYNNSNLLVISYLAMYLFFAHITATWNTVVMIQSCSYYSCRCDCGLCRCFVIPRFLDSCGFSVYLQEKIRCKVQTYDHKHFKTSTQCNSIKLIVIKYFKKVI